MMTSSRPYKRKRSPKVSTETIAKCFCDRASPESSIGGIPEDDISQVLLYEEFQHLELYTQKQYFDGICKALHDQKYFSKWCPRIDMMILQHYDKDNRLSKEEVEEAYALQEDLKEKWRLSKPPVVIPNPRYARPRMSEHTYWYDNNLHWSSDKSEFELEYAQDRERRLQYKPDATENLSREYGFLYHISSSLLWYRFAIFMGEIENSPTDNYKSSLDIRLWHVDGVSTLRLWDSKGGVRGRFDGLKESQTDALQFLNFVAGFKFPHPYDGVIAETVG